MERDPIVVAVIPVLLPSLEPLRRLGGSSNRTLRGGYAALQRRRASKRTRCGSTIRRDQGKRLDDGLARRRRRRLTHQSRPERGRRGHVAGLGLRGHAGVVWPPRVDDAPGISRSFPIGSRGSRVRLIVPVGLDVEDLVDETLAVAASVVVASAARGPAPARGGLAGGPTKRPPLRRGLIRCPVVPIDELIHEAAVGRELIRRLRCTRQELPVLAAQPALGVLGNPRAPVPGPPRRHHLRPTRGSDVVEVGRPTAAASVRPGDVLVVNAASIAPASLLPVRGGVGAVSRKVPFPSAPEALVAADASSVGIAVALRLKVRLVVRHLVSDALDELRDGSPPVPDDFRE
mmetsp:Transcript_10600/g.41410  ORF Transcript_10600/g.41410 Transcript_10600/m.41410 type:complete len:346 (+) Transcript_10600:2476-3513(+)